LQRCRYGRAVPSGGVDAGLLAFVPMAWITGPKGLFILAD
jgi:hypothetical protein